MQAACWLRGQPGAVAHACVSEPAGCSAGAGGGCSSTSPSGRQQAACKGTCPHLLLARSHVPPGRQKKMAGRALLLTGAPGTGKTAMALGISQVRGASRRQHQLRPHWAGLHIQWGWLRGGRMPGPQQLPEVCWLYTLGFVLFFPAALAEAGHLQILGLFGFAYGAAEDLPHLTSFFLHLASVSVPAPPPPSRRSWAPRCPSAPWLGRRSTRPRSRRPRC